MESLSLTCSPASSTHELSGKRPPSPDARTPQAKRHKTGLREVQSSREKRRRRKKKKHPMTRDSTGLKRNERTPSLPSDLPFPSTVENCPSLLSLHGAPFDDPSTPPHVHSKPVHMPSPLGSGNRPSASLPSLRQDHGTSTSHDENKVRRRSTYVLHRIQIIYYSLSETIKHCLRPLYPPLCARSVSTCFTNLFLFHHAGMSRATAVLSIGSLLISDPVTPRVGVSSARRLAPNVVLWCVSAL
jgi:hypothetical protein